MDSDDDDRRGLRLSRRRDPYGRRRSLVRIHLAHFARRVAGGEPVQLLGEAELALDRRHRAADADQLRHAGRPPASS